MSHIGHRRAFFWTGGVHLRQRRPTMADRPRVLLADPDENCRLTLALALEHITEFVAVTSTEEATAKLSEPWDVLIVSADCPTQGGIALLQHAQAQFPNMQRVLMSGPRPENFAQLQQAGIANDLVRKPALIEHLVNVVVGPTPAPAPPVQS